MLEISSSDIAALNDTDLRTLIGLLCEADLQFQQLDPTAARWGGRQTAADGGLDVRIALPTCSKLAGSIPRASTGFQVKRGDTPRGKIIKEMRPNGRLRPAI